MGTAVALLRGINVAGQKRVPMAELRELVAALGYAGAVTYIQSGNLVFDTDDDEQSIVLSLEQAIADRFGFSVPVVVRSAAELIAVARAHPLAGPGTDPRRLLVAFLDRPPGIDLGEVLDAEAYRPDAFTLIGRHLYLHYPNGSGRSKLTNALFEQALGVRSTTRNWTTVTRLARLAGR